MIVSRCRSALVSSVCAVRWLEVRPPMWLQPYISRRDKDPDLHTRKASEFSLGLRRLSTMTQASAYFEVGQTNDVGSRVLTRTVVRRMKVAELRDELELRGLDSSGVRSLLVSKLLDAISEPESHLRNARATNGDISEPMLHPDRSYALRFRGRTNPTQNTAGLGLALYDTTDGSEVWCAQQFSNKMTSFEVEYNAIIMGLNYARQHGANKIIIQSDNDVIIRQLKGEYKINKEELRRLYWAAFKTMEESFSSVEMKHIKKEENSRVIDLALKALGTRKSFGINNAEEGLDSVDSDLGKDSSPDTSVPMGDLSISPDETYLLRVDGGARGNPGNAGAGMVIYDSTGREIWCGWKFIDEATNNLAEYWALILGLQCARSLGITRLSVESDSLLVVKQVAGNYTVKDSKLKPMYESSLNELSNFADVTVRHIFRTENRRADELANQAMDTKDSHGFDEL